MVPNPTIRAAVLLSLSLLGLALLVMIFCVATGTRPASADGYHNYCWDIDGCPRRHKRAVHHRRRSVVEREEREVRYYREPEDMPPAWRDREGRDGRDEGQCLTDRRGEAVMVGVVSTEHNTEDAARESAKKLWMVQTAWRYGGQWIDLDNAARVREKCGPSNPMDTISGRLIEGVNKLSGSDGQNVRCEIIARPCSAPLKQVEGHR